MLARPCLSQARPPAASRRWRSSLHWPRVASSSMPIPCRSIATSASLRRAPHAATGRSLLDWHREGEPPLLPKDSFRAVFLAPERDELYARIDARFDAMLGAGALKEVERLAARQLDPLLPAMKAHGVPALMRHLRGELSLDDAATIGRADTRHYAKRQFTWFRHQLPEFEWVKPQEARGWLAAIVNAAWGPD